MFPTDWYWIVGGDESRVWSSKTGGYVAADDPACQDFTLVWTISRINSELELAEVLAGYGLPTGVLPTPVPAKVSALQFNLALEEMALLDMVEDAVAASNRETQLYFAKTDPFERAHAKIDELAAGIGKTSADVDDLFRLAITKS